MKNESNTRNSQRAIPRICALAVGLILVTSLPAAASWNEQRVVGIPGVIRAVDYRGAEGGICKAPNVIEPLNCNDSNLNQIFIDRFSVSTAPYSVYQTIRVTAYLYYWNGSRWTMTGPRPSQISGSWITPFANYGSIFGNPAPDMYIPDYCPVSCKPAFAGLSRQYSFTLMVSVEWLDSSTGNVLAMAYYTPGNNSTYDIGCADYAQRIMGRCKPGWGPRAAYQPISRPSDTSTFLGELRNSSRPRCGSGCHSAALDDNIEGTLVWRRRVAYGPRHYSAWHKRSIKLSSFVRALRIIKRAEYSRLKLNQGYLLLDES